MTTSQAFAEIVAVLQDEADPDAVAAMSEQYGIQAQQSFGVPMRRLLQLAKAAGQDHQLALDLWAQGSYEARTLAALIDEPDRVSRRQLQQWCEDFDNWAIVDTACFRLFDKTEHAWPMVDLWVDDERLFVRRAGFALLWALALHDTTAPDDRFRRALEHVQAHAQDPRPLVGKAVTMAMRAIATKRPEVREKVVQVAQQLVDRDDPPSRRVGRPIMRSFGATHQ